MDTDVLKKTRDALLTPNKGILAADESNSTAAKRLRSIDMESTEENRRLYRELFLTAPGIEDYLSGVILYDETIRQRTTEGDLFVERLDHLDIVPGIKVDKGTVPFPGFPHEEITEGLDGLAERLEEYREMGARFAKWRAVIRIGDDLPTEQCIRANAVVLARYARLCQDANIVPIVEPEVLLKGDHTIERCEEVVTRTVQVVFEELANYRVEIEYVILKSSMVLPGKDSGQEIDRNEIADRTVRALTTALPEEASGVVFLSGGQSSKEAMENLDAIADREPLPFEISFSYARALQRPALEVWRGSESNWNSAQRVFIESLQSAADADAGTYEYDEEE